MPNHTLLGQPAPALSLPNADGATYELRPGADGKPTVVFFYPQASTFGCTREVCAFRDALSEKVEFKDSGITVIGISSDTVSAIKDFATKYNVTYPMLSDESREARKAYNATRKMMGIGEARITFFIDSSGVVRGVYDSAINFTEHVKFVSRALKEQGDASKPAETTASESAAPSA